MTKEVMKILFIAPSAYLLGGVQNWLDMLSHGLRERGHEIIIGVPDGLFHRAKEYNQQYPRLNAYSFQNASGTHEGRVRGLATFLQKNTVDIIVGVNIGDLYQAYQRVSDLLGESRIVMTIHAIEANYFKDVMEYCHLLDAVVTTNRLSEAMVKSLHVVKDRQIYYAPYGVGWEGCQRKKNSGRLRIAWVGRVENQQKRVKDIVGIVKEMEFRRIQYQLSIAGEGPDLQALLEELHPWISAGRVHYSGLLKEDALDRLYRENDILLITSEWETGPIVAWEAMARGVAVVSSQYVGSKAENALVHEKTALLFPIGDVKEAAVQIDRLHNSMLLNSITEAGRLLVEERYTINASVNMWEESFRRICNSEKRYSCSKHKELPVLPTGRLERIIGVELSEKLRQFLPREPPADPGSEWPHSLQGISDQTDILNYAKKIDR